MKNRINFRRLRATKLGEPRCHPTKKATKGRLHHFSGEKTDRKAVLKAEHEYLLLVLYNRAQKGPYTVAS